MGGSRAIAAWMFQARPARHRESGERQERYQHSFSRRGCLALQVIWRTPMRGLSVAAAVCLTLLLSGCGGNDETIVRDELPVSCVTGSGSSRCPPGRGRFYYDYQSDRCLPTSAGRCGARMLFDTLDECTSYCGAAQ